MYRGRGATDSARGALVVNSRNFVFGYGHDSCIS